MKIMFRLLAPAALVGAMLVPAQAATAQYRHGVNRREHRQQVRIRQGVRNGELTRREARHIESREARIRVNEAYARRSGRRYTARERARTQRQLNRSSRAIYRQKHDRQDRH